MFNEERWMGRRDGKREGKDYFIKNVISRFYYSHKKSSFDF